MFLDLDCLANLILPISCHGIIFGTHMEALGMMGEEFSLPFPPYHQPLRVCGAVFALSPTTSKRYINVPGLFGQPDIANILSWHYLWEPYGGFGHDGRRIQPALPFPPYHQSSRRFWLSGIIFVNFHHFQDK